MLSLVVWAVAGKFNSFGTILPGSACANLFVYFGERRGKLKSFDEINRPLTLFPREHF